MRKPDRIEVRRLKTNKILGWYSSLSTAQAFAMHELYCEYGVLPTFANLSEDERKEMHASLPKLFSFTKVSHETAIEHGMKPGTD